MTPLNFLLYGFAIFRILYFVIRDDCPFEICLRVRSLLIKKVGYDEYSNEVVEYRTNQLVKLLLCPVCLSVWVAIPFAYNPNPIVWLVQDFALSGLAMLLWKWYTR